MIFEENPRFGRFANGKERKTSPKTCFRQSKKWHDFREYMIASVGHKCELCGYKYPGSRSKMLQVHHLDPENYELLDPARFSVLCASDHDMVERWITRINGKAFLPPENIQEWDRLIGRHLSQPARQKWEKIIAGEYEMPMPKIKGKKHEL